MERGRLVADWEGSPKVEFGFAQPVFDRMMACKSVLPTWHGELYFENHRGTLTTQARTKKNNRKLEQRLLQAEFINSLLPASRYPRKELDRVCKLLLLNQFHDIIPGSSIRLVYDRTEREHAEGLKALEALIQKAGSQLLSKDSSSQDRDWRNSTMHASTLSLTTKRLFAAIHSIHVSMSISESTMPREQNGQLQRNTFPAHIRDLPDCTICRKSPKPESSTTLTRRTVRCSTTPA